MELFELILVLLACVMVSSVFDQMISKMSLPLLQIGVGLVLALLFPWLANVHVEAELFLMLFIAPLLFREAKETSRSMLRQNLGAILSMAIALVLASVLAAGYMLHWIVPSIPLAAAFACAAALGPTDAAAVSAMSTVISLSERQSILLSGEALINDASGVVSFQFAIAAAVTGAFSFAEATGTFAVLFFGGILIGLLLGGLAHLVMRLLRRLGYVSTVMHVIYEVLSPFVIFLAAEEMHVSGILAVVAAGLLMQEHSSVRLSSETARQMMVSNSFWEVIIFLINGVLFVMLGMQLPKVMQRDDMGGMSPAIVIAAVLAVTAVILVMRFLWLTVMEWMYTDPETGIRGWAERGASVHRALVTTLAGPKGAVTLSIILTIPLTVEGGRPFPERDLIIFLTSGVILCTLILADFLLPRLSPKTVDEDAEQQLQQARLMVMEGMVREISEQMEAWEGPQDEYYLVCKMALTRYRQGLMTERFAFGGHGRVLHQLAEEVLDVQRAKTAELRSISCDLSARDPVDYDAMLRMIRSSLGYFDGAERVGALDEKRRDSRIRKFLWLRKQTEDLEKTAQIYNDTCFLAFELEQAAVDYLKKACAEEDAERSGAAEILLEQHEANIQSLWGRMMYGQSVLPASYAGDDPAAAEEWDREQAIQVEKLRAETLDRFRKTRHYADEVNANLMSLELDLIRRLQISGRITEGAGKELREQIYLMQTMYLE
ncbi:MAG: Na+/H+ antiporter [Firmicutes bacterium]|nr:Na+/H+ antiporter [Bacillota bacterium]